MGLTSRLLRLPRPRTFLYTMSLTTGASLITLSLLLNKISGLYGLLALLTGFELNPLQLSMYIYSMVALALTAYLAPHIRTQSPIHSLALAWFYVLDSIINAAYTATFAVTWFLVLAQHQAGGITRGPGDSLASAPGAGTIDDTSGFTNLEHNTDGDTNDGNGGIIDTPASGSAEINPSATTAHTAGSVTHGVLQPESLNSLGVVIALWTIRLYFCVVMLSYARMVLRNHIVFSAAVKGNNASTDYTSASKNADMAENPFAEDRPEGQGWKGRLARLMVSFPQQYWLAAAHDGDGDGQGLLGNGQDVSWMEGMGGRFRKGGGGDINTAGAGIGSGSGSGSGTTESGPAERERRRRSGTGPPPPPIQLNIIPGQKGLGVPLRDLS